MEKYEDAIVDFDISLQIKADDSETYYARGLSKGYLLPHHLSTLLSMIIRDSDRTHAITLYNRLKSHVDETCISVYNIYVWFV